MSISIIYSKNGLLLSTFKRHFATVIGKRSCLAFDCQQRRVKSKPRPAMSIVAFGVRIAILAAPDIDKTGQAPSKGHAKDMQNRPKWAVF